MTPVFCVVGKFPQKGFAKTRLSREIGEEDAIGIYSAMLKDFFYHYQKYAAPYPLHFYATPNSKKTSTYFHKLLNEFPKIKYTFHFQSDGHFFEKIAKIFKNHPQHYIHLTGTDIPLFPYESVLKQKIKDDTAVIGPDLNGGFYYFGSFAKAGTLFSSLLNQKNVLNSLISICEKQNIQVELINNWTDIDTLSDLKNCLKNFGNSLPHTYLYAKKLSYFS